METNRDRLARLLGWIPGNMAITNPEWLEIGSVRIWYKTWGDKSSICGYSKDKGTRVPCHPVPDTIDGLAALWPEDWSILVGHKCGQLSNPWMATAFRGSGGKHVHAEEKTEYEARLAVTVAVYEAMRKEKP